MSYKIYKRILGLVAGGLFPVLATGTIVQSNDYSSASQFAFPCSAVDLVNAGQTTLSSRDDTASINGPNLINDGVIGGNDASPTYYTGSSWGFTFNLNVGVNTYGYTITNISTYAGWSNGNAWRQHYDLYFTYQGDPVPGNWFYCGSYSNTLGSSGGCTKIGLTDTTGIIATNINAVKIVFYPAPEWDVYREVDVFGLPSTSAYVPPPIPNVYVATNGSHTTPFDTWDKAATNIQAAIDIGTNKIVLVSNGTYNVTSPLSITINTTVRSLNGATNTIVRRASSGTTLLTLNQLNAIFDGFTLREGNSGAMTLTAGTLQNCIIVSNTGNSAISMSGGTLQNCTIASNTGNSAFSMSGGTVRNSSIVNNSGGSYGSISMTGAGLVSNCVFTGNSANYDGGAVRFAASGVIANCIITNNTVGRWGGGVAVDSGAAPTIRNCLIARNSSTQQGGGFAAFSGSPLIESCTIVSNSGGTGTTTYGPLGGGGVWIGSGVSTLRMTNSILYFNTAPIGYNIAGTGVGGIGFSCASELAQGTNGNTSVNPDFMDVAGGDWRLRPGSPCLNTGTNLSWMTNALDVAGGARILGGVVDMGSYELNVTNMPFLCDFRTTVITGSPLQMVFAPFVSGIDTNITWYGWDFTNAGAYNLTGTGLPVVTNTYLDYGLYAVRLAVSNGTGNATSVVKTVQLYSTNGVNYVSTNGLSQWPYHTWAKAATNIQDAVTLAPNLLTLVSNGTYNITAEITPHNGSTLRSVSGATNTIIRRVSGTTRIFNIGVAPDGLPLTNAMVDGFTIREGSTGGSGGGINMTTGSVQNCIIVSNAATAGGSYGGGIYVTGGTVSNCVLAGNSCGADGGAIHMSFSGSSGMAMNCVITNNSARYGGGVQFDNVYGTSLGTLRNCLIVGNRATVSGGGVGCALGNGRIESCTIISNSAATSGGGVWQSSGMSLTNSIIYSNAAPSGTNIFGSPSAGYSCSPDLTNGLSGNTTNNPLFANFSNKDYHLALGSPCIDTGTNQTWMSSATNVDGNPRLQGTSVDMGCYEFASGSGPLICSFSASTVSGTNSLQVIFTALASGADSNITWYGWDFNDDGSNDLAGANLGVVTNTYAPGLYSVLLTASNASGSATSQLNTAYIRVYSSSTVAYVATNGLSQWPYETWARAATNIQPAIDVGPNMTIMVSNGTYDAAADIMLNNGTVLLSVNGAANTVVQRSGITNRIFNISSYSGTTVTNATIDGFTLRGSTNGAVYMTTGTVQNCTIISNSSPGANGSIYMTGGTVQNCVVASNTLGQAALYMTSGAVRNSTFTGNSLATDGGIYMTGGTVSNCTFAGNSATSLGGGINMTAGTVQNCTLTNNNSASSGGGIQMSAGTVMNCVVSSNSSPTYGGGISMTGGTVSNCLIVGNACTVSDGGGMRLTGSTGLMVNCTITNNSAGRWGGGIQIDSCSGGVIRNCLIARNRASQNGGGLSFYTAYSEIENCTIVSNSAVISGGGIYQTVNGDVTITNSIVYFNTSPSGPDLSGTFTAGYSCSPTLTTGVGGNTALDPLLKNLAGNDYRPRPGSPCIDSGTTLASVTIDLDGNPRPLDGDGDTIAVYDMGAYEVTNVPAFVCNFSAPTTIGSNSLQAVFTAAVGGPDTNITWYGWDFNGDGTNDLTGAALAVATNFYSEPGLYSVQLTVTNASGNSTNQLKTAYIRIYSSNSVAYVSTNGLQQWPYATWARAATNIQAAVDVGPGTTVLVSNGTYNVTNAISLNNGNIIRGLNGASNTIVRRSSGTSQVFDITLYGSTPVTNATIDGLTIREGNSGAIAMNAGTVQNCIVISNTVSGNTGIIQMNGGAVQNCSILNNTGGGYGAIDMITSVGLVSNCVFSGNTAVSDGGAVHIGQFARGQIISCIITNNSVGRWGGGVEFDNAGSPCLIRNCLIARNSASQQGGGISSWNSSPLIESCTIVSNSAGTGTGYPPYGCGGLYNYGSANPPMTNSIVYFNTAPSNASIGGPVNAGYSCATDLVAGVSGNITDDPLIVGLSQSDYRLKGNSPCLNAGLNISWMTTAHDLAGAPRINSGSVDIGAYEAVFTSGSVYEIR